MLMEGYMCLEIYLCEGYREKIFIRNRLQHVQGKDTISRNLPGPGPETLAFEEANSNLPTFDLNTDPATEIDGETMLISIS
jgi:hypothetical protein